MNKFLTGLALTATLMAVATVCSSATITLVEFKGRNIQEPIIGEQADTDVMAIASIDRGWAQYRINQDSVGEDPNSLGISKNWILMPGIERREYLSLKFISGLVNTGELGVVGLLSDENKWRQMYSEGAVLEFVLDETPSSTEMFVRNSENGLATVAGDLLNPSSIPFTGIDRYGKRKSDGVSLSYSEVAAVPLPLPSAAWLIAFTLVTFVVLSTRRQV